MAGPVMTREKRPASADVPHFLRPVYDAARQNARIGVSLKYLKAALGVGYHDGVVERLLDKIAGTETDDPEIIALRERVTDLALNRADPEMPDRPDSSRELLSTIPKGPIQ